MNNVSEWITVGKITTVFGIKGWVKVFSYTDPVEKLFSYPDIQLRVPATERRQDLLFDSYQMHGKSCIAHIKDCDDRNQALRYAQQEIQVLSTHLKTLEEGEFYWYQLEGLSVWTRPVNTENDYVICLGVVDHLLETGANDVLVVQASIASIDQKERLIPYIDTVVKRVSLVEKRIELNWDVDF